MARRLSPPAPVVADERDALRRRRRVAQRVLLETIRIDSPAYAAHQARLGRAVDLAGRVAAYETTLAEIGGLTRYREMIGSG